MATLHSSLRRSVDDVGPEELAWLAGFYEGEGTCIFNRNNSSRNGGGYLQVLIWQKDPDPLRRFQAAAGGDLRHMKKGGKAGDRFYWSLQLINEPARALLVALRPNLSDRRKAQIDSALTAYAARPRNHGGRHVGILVSPGQMRLL